MKIKNIKAYEILDSRANPTVETEVILESGARGRAAVPSGASTGAHEAAELRDGGKRYGGKGVLKAVENIKGEIRDCLIGRNCINQSKIDASLIKLDGTKNKSRLGANAILAVSMACARAGADYLGMPLWRYIGGINAKKMPLPMMNILNGGAHADNNLDIQEFMIVPVGAKSFSKGVEMCCGTYYELKKLLKSARLSTAVGDEGGFAPNLGSEEEAIEYIIEAVQNAGFEAGGDIKIALDAASSEWYDGGIYCLPKSGLVMDSDEICAYFTKLCKKYPIISIEDGAAEDDFKTWSKLTNALSDRVMLVGDDLFVTNTRRIQKGIDKGIANAVLIKPNQIGTVTETLDAVSLAKENGYGAVISHRSGETADTFISDLAVGTNAGLIKTGAPARAERTEKYNALLRIEREI